jgi:hypothetical protein
MRPKAGVNGAGHRFCFETYQVIEERTSSSRAAVPASSPLLEVLPAGICRRWPVRTPNGPQFQPGFEDAKPFYGVAYEYLTAARATTNP